MTIVPEGGWEDLSPREEKGAPQPVTGYSPAPSYLRCKVCDCGTLTAKKVFRLSGPAVAIGYILLIPSVLGIAFCALMLIAVNVGTITLESGRPLQSTFDARFRRNCASGFRSSYFQASGLPASQTMVEGVCECALGTYKETGSEKMSIETCAQRALDGALGQVGPGVNALYSGSVPHVNDKGPGRFLLLLDGFTSWSFIALGIVFFVGGLLGWLLVMKKRVLQCDICGAVVNAS